MTLAVVDLFSGIGGFSLGLERTGGFRTAAFCEIDPFCQRVLRKHWPDVPIYDDVRTMDYDGRTDVVCGGYPCQPFSLTGQRQGAEDDRHLWPAMFSFIEKRRPSWVIGENVVGHISMGIDSVLTDLERSGYAARAFNIPAIAVDAKHRRQRVWIIANDMADSKRKGLEGHAGDVLRPREPGRIARQQDGSTGAGSLCGGRRTEWPAEPDVGRMANGVSARVDRLKSLGNAVVPQIPEIIGRAILAVERECNG